MQPDLTFFKYFPREGAKIPSRGNKYEIVNPVYFLATFR